MKMRFAQFVLLVLGLFGPTLGATGSVGAQVLVLVSDNSHISEIDLRELRSLYKGRLTRVKGKPVVPLNTAPGSVDREAFLSEIMNLNELDYTGYWHVRRYSGQGVPPAEVETRQALFERLKGNNGLIGYIWVEPGKKPDLPSGIKPIRVR
ncbi:MAG TPA: hypothetical protein VFV57_10055 [Limnobacter sp.]|nr:hypothetical protein [Limnobacter sp.]